MIGVASVPPSSSPTPGPSLPAAAVLPVAGLVMLLVVWHALRLLRTKMPASRRRIRLANAFLMLLAVPLLAVGVSVLDHEREPRAWVLVWLACLALVWMCVMMALVDILNTLRLGRIHRRRARALLRDIRSGAMRRDGGDARG